ncbi:MAG TPA: 30S ribosome-binding factor RbfA [Ignavibacteriales bacterium]|nr:30S ribosome-binding factor RbfA [Ignavibacteriales bacterium]
MKYKKEKLESLIKKNLSEVFFFDIEEEDFKSVTISNLMLSPDLKIAKVYVSIFDKENREEIFKKILESNKSIRFKLAQRINYVKYIPELHFYLDLSADHVEKINEILKNITYSTSEDSENELLQ